MNWKSTGYQIDWLMSYPRLLNFKKIAHASNNKHTFLSCTNMCRQFNSSCLTFPSREHTHTHNVNIYILYKCVHSPRFIKTFILYTFIHSSFVLLQLKIYLMPSSRDPTAFFRTFENFHHVEIWCKSKNTMDICPIYIHYNAYASIINHSSK